NLRFAATSLLAILVLTAGIYFIFLPKKSPEIVQNETQKIENPQTIQRKNETVFDSNQSLGNEARKPEILIENSNFKEPNALKNIIENSEKQRKNLTIKPKNNSKKNLSLKTSSVSWNVEVLAGMPKIGNSFANEKIAVGEFLETDENSKAKIQVADIGNVEIAPNSRVKLVETKSTEHRLSLEKGELKAKIFAPPRLFIVDTPSAVAVDLGCEYTLEVDEFGNSKLHVTGGFVALENGNFSSIVPAGAIALTKKGKGIGTPFAEDSTADFQSALYKFDFENGGNAALETVLKEADLYDSLTLWHLLSKTQNAEREKVYDALKTKIAPPENVTREGILKLNKKMLDAWWQEIEHFWFD
ncbi:MAG TPA: FecR family protein, partial [Pyrinomonadaceae bacterium]|nr:FecR family protein [Pyrinomonadaceae bacterium]